MADVLRKAVQTDKKTFVVQTLKLTDAKAKRFRPICDAYQRNLDVINRRRAVAVVGLVGRDKPIRIFTPEVFAKEWPAIDEADVKLRRSPQNRLRLGKYDRVRLVAPLEGV